MAYAGEGLGCCSFPSGRELGPFALPLSSTWNAFPIPGFHLPFMQLGLCLAVTFSAFSGPDVGSLAYLWYHCQSQ